jgi:hypothetical protein
MRTSVTNWLLVASLLLPACGGKAWREARKANTAAAYSAFVARQPEHPKVSKARLRAEALDWEAALAADTSDAFSLFIATHPASPHVPDARQLAEERAWTEAKADGSIGALENYLARFGTGGEHEAEARQIIEQRWYERAAADDSVESWGRYLVRYPTGRWLTEARERRDLLGWNRAVEDGTRDSYQRYLREHPRGEHRDAARDWLASLRVHTLQPVLVYRRTWRDDRRRKRDRAVYQRDLERGLLYDLARDFTIRPTIVEDDPERAFLHVQERHGVEDGVGLLELVIDEAEGRVFEPSGRATDITATLSVYAPPTVAPVWSTEIRESTPARIYGSTMEALYTEAVEAFGATLRGVAFPVETVGPERPEATE